MKYTIQTNRIYSEDENGKLLAEITFPEIDNGVFCINHTFVDNALRGKGIAVLSTCSGIIAHERIRCVSIDNSRKNDEAQCWRTGLLSLLNLHSAQKSFTQEPGFWFLLNIFF